MSRYLLPLILTAFTFPMVVAQEEGRQGPATPEDLVKAFVQAMRDGDESAVEALLPEVGRLHQKVKLFAQKVDEKLKLDEEWKKELDKRLEDKNAHRIGPPVDIEMPSKLKPIVAMRPEYSAEIVEKKVVDNNTFVLVIDVAESKQAEKQRVSWKATRINGRWVLSVPEMKKMAELYERSMALLAGTDESHQARRQTLADLKQGKFTKYEDAEAAWKKASEVKLRLAGDKEFTLVGPGPQLPNPDGRSGATTIEFRLADKLEAKGLEAMKLPGSTQTIYVARDAILTHQHIQKVTAQPGDRSTTIVTFNDDCQPKLKQILDKPEYRMLAVFIDGKLVAAPLIDNKLTERLIIKGVGSSDFSPFKGK